MTRRPKTDFLLAVHLTSRGLAWIILEGPFSPFDWGLCHIRTRQNQTCLRRVERVLDRFSPTELVLEAFEEKRPRRSARIIALYRMIIAAAHQRGINVAIHRRDEVVDCYRTVGATTRQGIAEAVARQLGMLSHRLPKRRRLWDSEDPRLALFSAAALALTHYRLDALALFQELGDQAA